MDRMTSMATFVKVVESEGFSAAARALGISPSMATTHVRFLEERLGVRLLNRSTRRVSLTEAGQVYYERCLQILTEVEDADRAAQALQSTHAARCDSTRRWQFRHSSLPSSPSSSRSIPTCRST